jgi:hypothetical protein
MSSETLESDNLVTRAFKMTTYRTPDEVFTTSYKASTISGNTIAFNVRSPSNSALMSSIVYLRLRVKLEGVGGDDVIGLHKRDAAFLPAVAHFAKSDCLPVQCYACNSSTLTINGTSMNYNPSECLREIITSNVHKDAIAKFGQPIFDFGMGPAIYTADGKRLDPTARPMDAGFTKGCEEMADQLSSDAALLVNGGGYDYSGGSTAENARTTATDVYVEFIEPVVIGPLGPWSMLYPGTELSATSDFGKFSPYLPFVNNFQLNMQFDQTQLAGNLFALVRNGHDTNVSVKADIVDASVLCKFILPPPSYPLKSFDSFSVQSFEVVRYAQEIGPMDDRRGANRRQKPKVSYYTLNETPNFFIFTAKPRASNWPKQLVQHDYAPDAGGSKHYAAGIH